MSESELQVRVRLALSRAGHLFFRNNVGNAEYWNEHTESPDRVAYGVGGSGGSDLIGSVRRPDGTGRFVALELKAPGARTKPARAALQAQFRALINANGGYAVVVRSVEEALAAAVAAGAGANAAERTGVTP